MRSGEVRTHSGLCAQSAWPFRPPAHRKYQALPSSSSRHVSGSHRPSPNSRLQVKRLTLGANACPATPSRSPAPSSGNRSPVNDLLGLLAPSVTWCVADDSVGVVIVSWRSLYTQHHHDCYTRCIVAPSCTHLTT